MTGSRALGDLPDLVRELKTKGLASSATEQTINTGTAAGKAFLDMLAVSPSPRPTSAASTSSRASAKAKAVGVYQLAPACAGKMVTR